MSTNGVVSIVKDGSTIVKAIAGCNGYNADYLLFAIIAALDEGLPLSAENVYTLALQKKFGCPECLVVMDNIETIAPEAVPDVFRETFDKPRHNPRFPDGQAEYVTIVHWRPPLMSQRDIVVKDLSLEEDTHSDAGIGFSLYCPQCGDKVFGQTE